MISLYIRVTVMKIDVSYIFKIDGNKKYIEISLVKQIWFVVYFIYYFVILVFKK